MQVEIRERAVEEIEPLHMLYREEAHCQLIRDAYWRRKFFDVFTAEVDSRVAAYGAVANQHDAGRLMEFYTLPEFQAEEMELFRRLLPVCRATHIEAQTNLPRMLRLLEAGAIGIETQNFLFADAFTSGLVCPEGDGILRRREPPGDIHNEWILESDGKEAASGGFLTHYNPPYADIYMKVEEPHRRRGFGSYLVQELKRMCYDNGKLPSARCNAENAASRRTLEKAGLGVCAELRVGEIAPAMLSARPSRP